MVEVETNAGDPPQLDRNVFTSEHNYRLESDPKLRQQISASGTF